MLMRLAAVGLCTLLSIPAFAAGPERRPGYGVVESVSPLRQPESASAGASTPGSSRRAALYLVRVRMDDGTIQIREVKKRRFTVGDRVLLTNAGDVVPD